MSPYQSRIALDQDSNSITIEPLYSAKKLASYRLTEGLDSILDDERPLDLSAMPAIGRKGEQVPSVLHAIGVDYQTAAFPDFRERTLADKDFGRAFRKHHQKQLIDPDGESFVDITEVVQRKRQGSDVLDLEKKIARDIEWIALKNLDKFALSDMPTFFCLDDGEIALTTQFHLGPNTYPVVGNGQNRALLERLHEVLAQIPSTASTMAHGLSAFVDHYLTDEMDPEQIKAIAHGEVDASDQEWELDRLEWDLDKAMPLDRFLDLMPAEDWKQWFWNEDQAARDDGRSGYLYLLAGKIIEPVVAILDQKGEKVVDIWDGWHRTAACFVRNEEAIKAIVAKSYKLDHGPQLTI